MPHHCIAPGCTSGYKSNPEKVHFFAVPKDENIIKLWQNAIRRNDFVVKAGQFLCQTLFLAEDILWKRELTGSDGQVLGVSYYKPPRLGKGSIPSQFPWTESSKPLDNIPLHYIPIEETTQEHEDCQHHIEENIQEAVSHGPATFSFAELVACTTLQISTKWIRRTLICETITIESFVTATCVKLGDSLVTVNTKELIVQEDLNININILCKPLDPASIGISSNAINSIEMLVDILNVLDVKKLCRGASAANTLITYVSKVMYVDNIGTPGKKVHI